ncbi:L,D-transpeptidase [Bradyrhizobium sp. CCBAU 51753]|uniref:L,D-transpeptidase n=1 Tax=Bradyrhizobium sp. CCBAU 51753 TaxID=1325100 RepID=UPI00188A4AB3|nr:L,D-transpeptidase [Bradyrhizobium sp. CCBAU 51753]QOZ28173.1 L,D-transpeptidase [Bradyrhizobium sp. CCBAU 51753]
MMINRILTICAAAALGVAGTSFAHAQGYPAPRGTTYSAAPQPYPPGGLPDFDAINDDDDAPHDSAALPPPGPVMSPDDPRYGRPMNAPRAYSDRAPAGPVMSPDDPRYGRPMNAPPVYSDRTPTGPVMSPDDPRYGRPMGPPPVIYGDRAPGGQQEAYRDTNGVPAAGVVYSATPGGDDRGGIRPPEAVGGTNVTGAVPSQQPPVDANGRPLQIAALPPDEQPEDGQAQLPPNLRRQEVAFATKEPAGTIVVDTPNTYLYYVLGNGRAIRYGVRVGRDGFTWTGVQKITRKAEWPDWHPPTEMIERQPYLPRFMAGGPGNPLGARAMYLGSTVYRIHGTNQPSTIGKFVSSGCIGMLNEDVSDLFERTKVGTRVVVLPGGQAPGTATASAAPPSGGPAAGAPAPVQAQAGPVPGTQPTSVQPLPPPVTVR